MPIVEANAPPSSPRGYDKELVQVTANTTITAYHRSRLLQVNSGSDVTLTLPRNLPVGFYFEWEQLGAGQILFAAATGGTLTSNNTFDRSAGQYARGECEVTGQAVNGLAAVWNLSGKVTDSAGLDDGAANFTTVDTTNIEVTNIKAKDGTASATVTDSTGAFGFSAPVNITSGDTNVTTSSASTDGGTSVEPFLVSTTMTGVGGVGGRGRFYLTTNVALGSWSNALKGEVTYGAAGKTTGLGSAVLAEMTLSAGTVDGTYAPVEVELNLGTGASTGTATSLLYMSVNGADKATFDTSGLVFNLAGLTAGDGKCLQTGNTFGTPAATLKVKVGSTTYYLPLYAGQITTV